MNSSPRTASLIEQNTPISVAGCKPHKPTQKQKLQRALKACRKKHAKKRAGCERQARKRYGAKKARKAKKATKHRG